MKSLLVAMPLPGVGGRTIARELNTFANVQALCHSSLYLHELAVEFGCDIQYLEQHMHLPSDRLALFHANSATRLRNRGKDFYEARPASFYLSQYVGEYASPAICAAALLMAVDPKAETVVLLDRADSLVNLTVYQMYAETRSRHFAMLDITRSGITGLGLRRFAEKDAFAIDVVERRPADAARAIVSFANTF